jgi:Ca2+-binding EF-hand superfamily protein
MKTYLAVSMAITMIGSAAASPQDRTQRTIRFADMDTNNDGVITQREWRGSPQAFQQQDWNGDGILSGDEVRPGARRTDQQSRAARRPYVDTNDDGLISRAEWRGTAERFDALDQNHDGVLTIEELTGDRGSASDLFALADRNGDGTVTRDEWPWLREQFDERDVNRDGRLTQQEVGGTAIADTEYRSEAWRMGRERGLLEGRQAGKEDKDRNQGWDLEGQRELETADSGYETRFGLRADYQAGYREGFRRGYREGYGPR